MAGVQAKGGRKNRKFGRQKQRSQSHKRYTAEMRWEKNKKRRMKRHIRHFPGDMQAQKLLAAL